MQYLTLEQFRATNSESAAHEASSRTDWLREKLRLSAADTRPRLSHEQVMSEAQALIDRKRKTHAENTTA